MGTSLVRVLSSFPAELVGGVDHAPVQPGIRLFPDVEAMSALVDVVIDFTHDSAVLRHADAVARHRVGWVLGTTALSEAAEHAVAAAARSTPVVQAANFSVGVTIVLALVEGVARALPSAEYDAEILEMHHRHKADAPSGTALALGKAIARARGADPAVAFRGPRHGVVGPRSIGEIGFAVQRGGQIVGDHAVSFTADQEQVVIEHRAYNRDIFAAGAIRAALWINGKKPGLYTMRDVVGI